MKKLNAKSATIKGLMQANLCNQTDRFSSRRSTMEIDDTSVTQTGYATLYDTDTIKRTRGETLAILKYVTDERLTRPLICAKNRVLSLEVMRYIARW